MLSNGATSVSLDTVDQPPGAYEFDNVQAGNYTLTATVTPPEGSGGAQSQLTVAVTVFVGLLVFMLGYFWRKGSLSCR